MRTAQGGRAQGGGAKFAFLAPGAAPGAPLQDLPDEWRCPECGAAKGYFLPVKKPGAERPAPPSPAPRMRSAA